MQLTLLIEGKPQTFVAPFVSGRALRRTLEIQKTTNFNDLDPEALDEVVDLVANDIYSKQFTRDQFYDGIESTDLIPAIRDAMMGVINKNHTADEGSQDPNGQTTAETPTTT